MACSDSYDELIGHKATFRLKNEPNKLYGEIQRVDKENSTITFYKVTIIEEGKQPRVLSGLQEYRINELRDVNVLEQVNQALKRASLGKPYERHAYPQQKKKRSIRHEKETPKHLDTFEEFDSTLLYMMNIVEKAIEKTKDENGQYESKLPPNCTLLDDHESQIFRDALAFLKKQPHVAVTFEGVNMGRNGQLSWILGSTRTHTMFFDIKAMGKNAFDAGLRDFLQYPKTTKVIHDCRRPSDILHHQYETKLNNVFDTQIGTVMAFKVKNKNIYPRYVTSLADCLRKELCIDEDEIHVPYLREHNPQQDEAVWCLRPAPSLVYQWMTKHVQHLLDLRERQMELIMMEFTMGVDIYLRSLRDLYNAEAEVRMTNQHLLPSEFSGLPMIVKARLREEQPRKSFDRQQSVVVLDEQGRIENWTGYAHPSIVSSRDTIWHMRRLSDKSAEQRGDRKTGGTTDRQKGRGNGYGEQRGSPFLSSPSEAGEPRAQQQAKDTGKEPISQQQQAKDTGKEPISQQQQAKDTGKEPVSQQQQNDPSCDEQQTMKNVTRKQRSNSFGDTASYEQCGEAGSAQRNGAPEPNKHPPIPTRTSSGPQMSHTSDTERGSDKENRPSEMTGCGPREQTQRPAVGERKQSSSSAYDSAANSTSGSESKQDDYVAEKLSQAVQAHREKEKNTKDIHNIQYVFRAAGELLTNDLPKKSASTAATDDLTSKKVRHPLILDPKQENAFDMIPSHSKLMEINPSRKATISSFDMTPDHQPLQNEGGFDITTFKEAIAPPPYTVSENTRKDGVHEALAAILPRVQNQLVLLDGARTSHHATVAHSEHRGRSSSGDGNRFDSHSQYRGRNSSGEGNSFNPKTAPWENRNGVSSSTPAQAGRGGTPPVKREAGPSTPSPQLSGMSTLSSQPSGMSTPSPQPSGMSASRSDGVVAAGHSSPTSASPLAPQTASGSGGQSQSDTSKQIASGKSDTSKHIASGKSNISKQIASGKSIISILGFKSPQEVMAMKLKAAQEQLKK